MFPAQRNVAVWSIGAAAVLLPTMVGYLNRASALLLTIAALGAVLARPGVTAVVARLKTAWPMFVFVAWSALTALWAETPGLAVPQALQLLGLLIEGVVILAAVDGFDETDKRRLFRCIAAGLGLGLGLMAFDWGSGCWMLLKVQGLRNKLGPNGCWLPYLKTGPTVLAVIMPLFWDWAERVMGSMKWARRALVWSVTLCLFLLSRVMESHAAMGGMVLAMLTVLAGKFIPGKRLAGFFASLVAVIILAAPVIAASFPPSKTLAVEAPWLPNSTRHRIIIWQFAEELISQRPMLGWGLNGARAVPGGNDGVEVWNKASDGSLVMSLEPRMPLHPHDVALQIWLETGLIGAVLAAFALAQVIRKWASPFELAQVSATLLVAMVSFGAWQAWWLSSLWLIAAFNGVLRESPRRSGTE